MSLQLLLHLRFVATETRLALGVEVLLSENVNDCYVSEAELGEGTALEQALSRGHVLLGIAGNLWNIAE